MFEQVDLRKRGGTYSEDHPRNEGGDEETVWHSVGGSVLVEDAVQGRV